jgi:uncharacterized protein (TIGR04255 family)
LKLPKKISPNPLISSTIEVRFVSDISSEEAFEAISKVLKKDFPQLKKRDIPEKKDTPELEYLAKYILSNDDYHIFIDNNIIAFENIGEYHLWDNYYPIVKENLLKISEVITINEIKGIGLRYISFFKEIDTLSECFNFKFESPLLGYKLDNEFFRTQLCKNDVNITLHLVRNAEIIKNEISDKGTLIDIDVTQSSNLSSSIGNDLFDIIQTLHQEEKTLFFSILNEDFLRKRFHLDY